MLLTGNILFAQDAKLITNGIIEYEKSVNTHALMKSNMAEPVDRLMQYNMDTYKARMPQFKKLQSFLSFSRAKTLYTPIPNSEVRNSMTDVIETNPLIDQGNTIYTDLSAGSSINQKQVFEETFLVKDNIRKIDWKITNETRDIAGYTCRRANAIIMDSIYVVAFYTGQIPVSGGPESFSGLPGMILGIALPHDNITWFATKVTASTVPPADLKPPVKGKVVNNKELRITLEQVLKPRGNYAKIYFKGLLL